MVDQAVIEATLAANYLNVYVVDLAHDTAEATKLDGWVADDLKNADGPVSYSHLLESYLSGRVFGPDRASLHALLGPEQLAAAFGQPDARASREMNFRVADDGAIHYYNVLAVRLSNPGEPLLVLLAFRNIDYVGSAQKERRDEGLNSAYTAISQVYMAMFRVNVKKGTYYAIRSTDAIRQFETPGSDGFAKNVQGIVRGLATPDSLQSTLEFIDLSTLDERMRGRTHIASRFTGRIAGQCELHWLKEDEDPDGSLRHVILAVEANEEDKLDSVVEVLARNFQNVFWIDLAGGTAKILKLDGYITKGLDRNDHQFFPYPTVLTQYIADRVHPDDRQMLANAIGMDHLRELFLQQGKQEHVGSYRVLVNGETHTYQYNCYKLHGMDYIVCGFQNIDAMIDETLAREREQREIEEAYRRQLEEQLKIFDNLARNFRNVYIANMEDGTAKILKLGDGYDLEAVTKLAGKTFPYQAVVDQWIAQRVHPDDKERVARSLSLENLGRVFAERDDYAGVYRAIEDGKVRNYQFNLSKLDDHGSVIAGFQIIDDMIEEHLAAEKKQREKEAAYQQELVAARDEADRANNAKTEFLLRMSHDIRTPLNGIVGMLDIADKFADDVDKQTECREKIRESSRVLLELVNEVLDMSKLESGEIVLEHAPFSLIDVSKDVFNAVMKQADERGIQIVQENCKLEHKSFLGSPLHVKRLMMNIVSNAVKYNKEHGKVFITCREVSCDGGVATVEFKCRDTGIGMSPEFQRRLFEPFAQESASPRTKYAGTGLGMSIAKSIVDTMGGTISFESVQGQGTTFDVLLPLDIDPTDGVAQEPQAAGAEASIAGMNILLVEDNELNMEIARFLLEEEGAHVTTAVDGQKGVEAFVASAEGFFDAVLMDIMMPVLDGYGAARTIRALDRADAAGVPIIAMTANAFVEDKLAAKEAGMNEHVAKPLDMQLLVQTVAGLVQARA